MKKKYIYIHKKKGIYRLRLISEFLTIRFILEQKKVLFYRLCCVLFLNLISP